MPGWGGVVMGATGLFVLLVLGIGVDRSAASTTPLARSFGAASGSTVPAFVGQPLSWASGRVLSEPSGRAGCCFARRAGVAKGESVRECLLDTHIHVTEKEASCVWLYAPFPLCVSVSAVP